ncbi:cytochrome P450 [Flammula alnicola]|nr:cytochrome P450 [Flammula alnicola]
MPSVTLLFLSLAAAALVAVLIRWYFTITSRLVDIPGPPSPSYMIGHLGELERAPMGTKMNVWAKRYGQTYKLRGPFLEPWLILGDPRGASYVLQGKNYVRPESDRLILEIFFGRGLFCAEGEEYRKMRKSLNPAFTFQSIQEVSHVFFDLAYNLKRQWEEILDGQKTAVFDIGPNIHMLSLDAISMTMFMHNLGAGEGTIPKLLHDMTNSPTGDTLTSLLEAFASIFPQLLYLPSPLKTYGNKLRTEFGKIAEEVWSGKEGAGMHAKVLDALAKQEGADVSPISKDEAIAQIIGIMFAGSETTANVIAECLYELSRQRPIQDKLRQEINSFQVQHGHFPRFEHLMTPTVFPYLDAVIRECLRTKAVLREAVEDDIIPLQFPVMGTNQKEIHVKAGQVIQIPIRDGVNADEAIWGSDVADFRPERWIDDSGLPPSVEFIRAQGHVLTFGDGPKACLGRTLAIAEIKIVISVLISHFQLEDEGLLLDFYHLGGNTIKPLIRGREAEGVKLPVRVGPL